MVPESPRWLLMKDPNSREGINSLNYIAWFNSSDFRVPTDATLDTIGQVVEENHTINNTNIALLKMQLNQTIQKDINAQTKRGGFLQSILKQLKQLFCDVRNSKTEFQILLIFI